MRNPTRFHLALTLIVLSCGFGPQPVLAQCDSGTVCTCPNCPLVGKTHRQGRWFVLQTANFQVCCERSEASATQLARHAEALRNALRAKWLGEDTPANWNPLCQIVLHSSRSSYIEAVGRGADRTVGSSSVKTDKDRIVARRIDLLEADTDFLKAALPHELTHVVLSEKFVTNPLPRWADEGIAILADPLAKQGRHRNDLVSAYSNGTAFHAATLLAMEDYPRPDRFGAFYGQSASLAEFLIQRKSPAQFVAFMERAKREGYDSALKRCYNIDGIGELDRQWSQHVACANSPQ